MGGGGCSVGGSGGDSSGAGRVAAHPAAGAVVELQWRPNPEPGAGSGPPSGLG